MAARPDTWMPVYWGDYMRDTGHLNNAGHGAYLMLIKHYWCTGARLRDDDRQLARIACCDSIDDWLEVRPQLEPLFKIADGVWRQKRVDEELGNAIKRVEKRQKQTAAATQARMRKQGAEKRNDDRNDNGQADVTDNVTKDATSAVTLGHPHPQSQSPNGDSSLRSQRARETAAIESEFADWYARYPHKVGKKAALKAYKAARKSAEQETLIKGVEAYIRDKPPDRAWCNPATWLNDERWLDIPAILDRGKDGKPTGQTIADDGLMRAFGEAGSQ